MTTNQISKGRKVALSMLSAGAGVSILALMAFFGGSERDPAWVWTLFYVAFFGGFLVGGLSLLALIALAFIRPKS